MGVEQTVKKMKPKKKKLFMNILSILMIITLLYAVISAVEIYLRTGDFWRIIDINFIVSFAIPLLFIWLAYSILSGKKVNIPNEFKSKGGKKTQFNIPDTYGVRGRMKKPQRQQIKKPQKLYGTWVCPKCKYLAKGAKCNKCGYIRQD
jgi:hypothetical protein